MPYNNTEQLWFGDNARYVRNVPVWYAEVGYHRLDGWLGEPWDFWQGLLVCGDLPQESRHALPTHPAAAGELS